MKDDLMKRLITIILVITVVVIAYLGVYFYENSKIIERYATGYQKNVFGDYCRSEDGYTYAVHPVHTFSKTGNLSIAQTEGNVDAVIWFNLFGEIKKIGVVVTSEDNKVHQIVLNRDFEVTDQADTEVISNVKEEITKLRELAEEEWGI